MILTCDQLDDVGNFRGVKVERRVSQTTAEHVTCSVNDVGLTKVRAANPSCH